MTYLKKVLYVLLTLLTLQPSIALCGRTVDDDSIDYLFGELKKNVAELGDSPSYDEIRWALDPEKDVMRAILANEGYFNRFRSDLIAIVDLYRRVAAPIPPQRRSVFGTDPNPGLINDVTQRIDEERRIEEEERKKNSLFASMNRHFMDGGSSSASTSLQGIAPHPYQPTPRHYLCLLMILCALGGVGMAGSF